MSRRKPSSTGRRPSRRRERTDEGLRGHRGPHRRSGPEAERGQTEALEVRRASHDQATQGRGQAVEVRRTPMTDTLREFADQHPELLTVECECVNVPAISLDYSPRCTICKDTGRRLKTLEELLEHPALKGEAALITYVGPH